MVITILEAVVSPDKWASLERIFFEMMKAGLPPQIIHTFLMQSFENKNSWRIITLWRSREALDDVRKLPEVPAGVRMFRSVGAEPVLSVFDVRESSFK